VFDAKKAGLAELKARFEREMEVHSPDAVRLGRAYLAALAEFLERGGSRSACRFPAGCTRYDGDGEPGPEIHRLGRRGAHPGPESPRRGERAADSQSTHRRFWLSMPAPITSRS
jgi:hypothetical protein